MNERLIAIREGALCDVSDKYFAARPHLACREHRKIFDDGFNRAWDRSSSPYPQGLTDEKIQEIAEGMPGGITGYRTHWGFQQFARAIEKAHGIDGFAGADDEVSR